MGDWRLKIGDCRLETKIGVWRLDIVDWRLEIEDWRLKLKIENWRFGIADCRYEIEYYSFIVFIVL